MDMDGARRRPGWLTRDGGLARGLSFGDELYRALSDAAFEAVSLAKNRVCTGRNRAARRLFGYSDEGGMHLSGQDLAPKDPTGTGSGAALG